MPHDYSVVDGIAIRPAKRNILGHGYDPATWVMWIQFTWSEAIYRYSNVDPAMYKWLTRRRKAGEYSIGQDFYATIRANPALYPYEVETRVADE